MLMKVLALMSREIFLVTLLLFHAIPSFAACSNFFPALVEGDRRFKLATVRARGEAGIKGRAFKQPAPSLCEDVAAQ